MSETEMEKRNILLCVAGMTPQIITETLFVLNNKGERIDEIRVITTLEGRNKLLQFLLHKETGKFYEFCRDFGLDAKAIKFDETTISLLNKPDGTTLEDIRTPEENEIAGNQICEIVRELCKRDDIKIHASVAGGRKTMSIYLTLAMSLFGRSEDSLSHVLVNEDFENNRDFFYPPPQPRILTSFNPQTKESKEISTATAQIYLAPIPFIRLRGIGKENEKFGRSREYNEMVQETQKVLDIREKEYDLLISLKNNFVVVRGQNVKLTPREFFFYLMFAKRRVAGQVKIGLKDLVFEDFEEAFSEIFRAKGKDVGWEDLKKFKRYSFAETMLNELESGGDKDFDSFRSEFSVIVARIKERFEACGIDDNRYYLVSVEDGTASYQLKISPTRIIFKH